MYNTMDYEKILVNEMELEADEFFRMVDQGHSPQEIAKALRMEIDEIMERYLDLVG